MKPLHDNIVSFACLQPIGGVVDFMDDPEEDDESWAASGPLETAKRQKKEKLAEERLAADIAAGRLPPEAALTPAPASRKPSGSGVPVETPVVVKAVVKRHVPGQLVHAEVAPASAGVQVRVLVQISVEAFPCMFGLREYDYSFCTCMSLPVWNQCVIIINKYRACAGRKNVDRFLLAFFFFPKPQVRIIENVPKERKKLLHLSI